MEGGDKSGVAGEHGAANGGCWDASAVVLLSCMRLLSLNIVVLTSASVGFVQYERMRIPGVSTFICNKRLALAPRREDASGCRTAGRSDSPSFSSLRCKFSIASWRIRSTFFSLRNPRYGHRRIPSERQTRISVRLLIPRSCAALLAVNVNSLASMSNDKVLMPCLV